MRNLTRLIAACAAAIVVVTGCAGSDVRTRGGESDRGTEHSSTTSPSSTGREDRPDGPAADLSQEIAGGAGPFIGSLASQDLAALGYTQTELVAAGEAVRYDPGPEWTEDGRWTFTEVDEAPAAYRTRALVRRPTDPDDFSGTVVLEWLNVSGGLDADPEWSNLHEELIRQGHAWVGLSAQLIGVEGGQVLVSIPGAEGFLGKGLINSDPARYGSLDHPGDAYSYDIYTQVARALRSGDGLGGTAPEHVLAAGESQSAMALVTYHNGVQPLTLAFDGFFVHSRGSMALPVVGPGEYADLASAFGGIEALMRDDLRAPVMTLQSEGDVTGLLNSSAVRQADSAKFRLWEVAGTAHADQRMLGAAASLLDCGAPINDGPMHVAAKSAFHHFAAWVASGDPPPAAPWIDLVDGAAEPTIARDNDGLAVGGLRLAPVEVPVEVLSGESGSSEQLMCQLLGSTQPMPADRLAALYPDAAAYQDDYDAAVDGNAEDGYLLDADRAAMAEYAHPDRIPG